MEAKSAIQKMQDMSCVRYKKIVKNPWNCIRR